MPGAAIRAILFDKDGTLFDFQATWGKVIDAVLDTLAPDAETRTRMARAGGYDPLNRRFLAGSPIVSGSNAEIATLWAAFRPAIGAARIAHLLDEVAHDILADPRSVVPAVPDLPALLAGLRARGYALGVATNDSEEGARVQLAAAGILDAFDFLAGYDSGHGVKPDPGVLLAFGRTVRASPSEIAVVGDSRHDLETARAASAAMAVGVLTGPATHDDLAPFADHVLHSIGHLPALLDRLAG